MQPLIFLSLWAGLIITGLLSLFMPDFYWLIALLFVALLVATYDVIQRKHTILRNFPLFGHVRFLFEMIRPEIAQYFIESDLEGRPFNRERRSIVYQRAKGVLDTQPYGTRMDVYQTGYEWINPSMRAHAPVTEDPRILIGGPDCKQPYAASVLNISAMSFGAISKRAVRALNKGAKLGGFYHNTGEGGLSTYHLESEADLAWQIGTGYFGCRTLEGGFCPDTFAAKATLPSVKLIEIKVSQGAKPGHGGILPGAKVTAEIAEIRGVHAERDVISPPVHSAFSTPIEMMHFIKKLRALSGGKPVGFKICIGAPQEFFALCKAMLNTGITPDFITVDGAEGGTGAAPLEFANAVGTPLEEGLAFVDNALRGVGLRDHIKVICAGKLTTGFLMARKLALGADLCNSARAMMLALGCVQSLKCNSNECPTGVATQDPTLVYGLNVNDKSQRVARFHRETVSALMELLGAAGIDDPSKLTRQHIHRRVSTTKTLNYAQIYQNIEKDAFLGANIPEWYAEAWAAASADSF